MNSTFRFLQAPIAPVQQTLGHAVLDGLSRTPKTLPCRFFYDENGSQLFEQICELPEYYPTRTERALFDRYADAMIGAATGTAGALALTELGSGSSCKTRLLIEAALRRQERLHYTPIDISGDFLRASALTLLREYPPLDVTAIAAEYSDALQMLLPADPETPQLFLFLGSNIGNFERPAACALLTEMRAKLRPDDRILIGVDRVKDIATLEAAYDDAAGVTAAFNKNLLARINRELGADFDLDQWTHTAPFVTENARIEMWLTSDCDQTVTLTPLETQTAVTFAFRAGEGIHTENSHKYTPSAFESLCAEADLRIQEVWSDDREWFSVLLLQPGARA